MTDFECLRCSNTGHDCRDVDCVCSDCEGSGWVECDRGGVNCPYSCCACEAAWERQEADKASEPPVSMDEQHRAAWKQKQALKATGGDHE